MITRSMFSMVRCAGCLSLAVAGVVLWTHPQGLQAADTTSEFSNPRLDLGLVVQDAARTAKFLTNVIGYKEVRGFSVSADLGRKIGLIDGHPVDVRVFAAEDSEQASRIKVLSFPAAPGKKPDQKFIHNTLGVRYLTLFMKDMKGALDRIKAAGLPLEGASPVDLGGGTFLTVVRDPDGNFFELIGPMK